MKGMMQAKYLVLAIAALLPFAAHSGPTKVGNGDDGADLEGAAPLESGPVVEARGKAVALLEKLGVQGVPGLGGLLPEVRDARLLMARKDAGASLSGDQGGFHSDMRGYVFARTFAEPRAATRFFPASLSLTESQLVALHIHEGLHRSLPASVRENEAAVAAITLSITSPDASFDRVRQATATVIPAETGAASGPGAPGFSTVEVEKYPVPEDAPILTPSNVGYSFVSFLQPDKPTYTRISHMHLVHSYLYPFGSDRVPLGIGIQASLISRPTATQAGPLGLSARMRLWSSRGFDVGAYAMQSLNMLSSAELKNSPIGRDVTTLGLSMRKDMSHFYAENFVGLTLPGEVRQRLGNVDTTYSYGQVIGASTHFGARVSKFRLGAFAEVNLADYFRVSEAAFTDDSGRYRIISGGPELQWIDRNFSAALTGRFLLNSTQEANFDYLGNVMGEGVAQGSVAASVSYLF